jgi:hypothetical protein
MTIVSMQAEDKSDFLCKRYASMATSYFDRPEDAAFPTAQVPLENLFRVLEMYKNNTFSDESRKGVLALNDAVGSRLKVPAEDSWQINIKSAMHRALEVSFVDVSEDEAVKELQNALRWLVVPGDLPDRAGAVERAKVFFNELSSAL